MFNYCKEPNNISSREKSRKRNTYRIEIRKILLEEIEFSHKRKKKNHSVTIKNIFLHFPNVESSNKFYKYQK